MYGGLNKMVDVVEKRFYNSPSLIVIEIIMYLIRQSLEILYNRTWKM